MRTALRTVLWVLVLTILLLGIPMLSGSIADMFDYQAIDPDGSYAWISTHHIVQAVIFIILIFLLMKFKSLDFGFGWGNVEVGRKYVLRFTLIFGAGSLVSHVLLLLTGSLQQFEYPLTAANITGQLAFQLFLSGPSEELIFRAFAITMLALVIRGRIFGGKISIPNMIAAIIFGLAHVSFSFDPLAAGYNPMQVILSVILGIFYGDCYEKTKSMYYPMMMHSISNVIMVSLTVIATALFLR